MTEEKTTLLTALVVEPKDAHDFEGESVLDNVSVHLETIADAKQALLWLKENTPDFILVNVQALEDKAISLIKMVRASKRLHRLPITVLHKSNNDPYHSRIASLGIRSTVDIGLPAKNILLQAVKDYKIANEKNEKKAKRTHDLMSELKEKLKNEDLELPSQPKLLFQLINYLNDDNSTIQQISDLVEKEPTVCAKIIKAANSVHFAAAKPVVSASDAVMRIGLKRTLNYVLVIEQGQMFETELEPFKQIRQELWQHAVSVAITGRYIGQCLGYENVDSLFAFGLLHDIGKLALLRLLHEFPKAEEMDEEVIWPILNKMHTRLGASMLTDWQFPQEFIDVVRYHHDEPVRDKHGKYLVISSYSNLVAHFAEKRIGDSEIRRMMRLPHVKVLKFKPDYFKAYEEHMASELAMMSDLMN